MSLISKQTREKAGRNSWEKFSRSRRLCEEILSLCKLATRDPAVNFQVRILETLIQKPRRRIFEKQTNFYICRTFAKVSKFGNWFANKERKLGIFTKIAKFVNLRFELFNFLKKEFLNLEKFRDHWAREVLNFMLAEVQKCWKVCLHVSMNFIVFMNETWLYLAMQPCSCIAYMYEIRITRVFSLTYEWRRLREFWRKQTSLLFPNLRSNVLIKLCKQFQFFLFFSSESFLSRVDKNHFVRRVVLSPWTKRGVQHSRQRWSI